jgi:hypothetical protein
MTGRLSEHADVLETALERWAARDGSKADACARQAANVAVDAIDGLLRELHQLRARLVGEIRESDDQAAVRVDELLARSPSRDDRGGGARRYRVGRHRDDWGASG